MLNKRPLCCLVGNTALILLKAQTGENLLQHSHNAEENQKITPHQENIKNINISSWDFPESLFPSPLLSTVAGGGGWRIQDLNKSQPSSRGPTNDSYSCPLNPPPWSHSLSALSVPVVVLRLQLRQAELWK